MPTDFAKRQSNLKSLLERLQLNEPVVIPELVSIYSSSRSCEFIDISDGTYLIYDLYLSDALRLWNDILVDSDGPWLACKYACKFMAERLRDKGSPELAKILATVYLQMHDSRNERSEAHESTSAVQNVYVLAHEVFHYVMRIDPFRRNSATTEAKRLLMQLEKRRLYDRDFTRWNAAYGISPTDLSSKWSSERSSWLQQHDPHILNEIACDYYALLALVEIGASSSLWSIQDVCEGSLLALRHLRMFQVIETFVDNLTHGREIDAAFSTEILTTRTREQAMLLIMSDMYDVQEAWDRWGPANTKLMALMHVYDDVIETPILTDIRKLIVEGPLAALASNTLSNKSDSEQRESDNAFVDKATGW